MTFSSRPKPQLLTTCLRKKNFSTQDSKNSTLISSATGSVKAGAQWGKDQRVKKDMVWEEGQRKKWEWAEEEDKEGEWDGNNKVDSLPQLS